MAFTDLMFTAEGVFLGSETSVRGSEGEAGCALRELERMRHRANPKRHKLESIVASIKRFGFVMPPCVCSTTFVLVAGHGRLEALRAIRDAGEPVPRGVAVVDGEWVVPCRLWAFATEAERDDYLVADNRLTEAGGWDDDELRRFLAGRGHERLDTIGLTLDEYNRLMSGFRVRPQGNEDVAPPLPKTPVARVGELWELGEHRLVIGDSLERSVLDRALGGAPAPCLWTDPPYNVSIADGTNPRKTNRPIKNDAIGTEFPAFLARAANAWWESVIPGAATYVAMSSQEWPTVDQAMRTRGYHWSTTIIWAKDRFTLTRRDFHSQYEPIWYGWRGDAPRARKCEARDVGDLWAIPRPSSSELHPTMKPVELVVRCLKHTSRFGDLVLDPFGGSGTTAIACEQIGRKAALVELDPAYADVIIERVQQYAGVKAVRR